MKKINKIYLAILILLGALILVQIVMEYKEGKMVEKTPTFASPATAAATSTPSLTFSAQGSLTPSESPLPSSTVTIPPTPTATQTETVTPSATATATATASATATATATSTYLPTWTVAPPTQIPTKPFLQDLVEPVDPPPGLDIQPDP